MKPTNFAIKVEYITLDVLTGEVCFSLTAYFRGNRVTKPSSAESLPSGSSASLQPSAFPFCKGKSRRTSLNTLWTTKVISLYAVFAVQSAGMMLRGNAASSTDRAFATESYRTSDTTALLTYLTKGRLKQTSNS